MLKSFGILLLLFSLNATAQSRQYEIYFDVDNSSTTGCQVIHTGLADINGVESKVTIQTINQPPTITSTTLHQCVGLTFDAGVAITPAALGFNTGDLGADVFEAVVSQAELNIFGSATVRVYYATGSNSAEDVVLVQASGDPILLGFFNPIPIPTLGLLSILFLVLAFLLISRFKLPKAASVIIVLLAVSPAVWAMTIIIDGQTGDWSGFTPAAIDPSGDTSQPGSFADITSVYALNVHETIYLRMDIVELENQLPVADDGLETTLEDTMVTLTLTGSDADGDAITFSISNPPTSGTLSAISVIDAVSSSVDYTPNGDFNGSDSFAFVANDGQADSAPASFEVTVDAVNDPPSFATGGDVDQNEGAGPYNQIWATAVSAGPANESGQTLSFNITANDNAGIFATLPSIDPSGALSFEGLSNTTGVANITVELEDDGGILNGGNDTSTTVNFSITLLGVNDEPGFTAGTDQTVLEDAATVSVPGWASGISAGPPDEAGQVLSFIIDSNTNPTLFSVGPAVDGVTGDLTYTLADDGNGSAEITLHLMDDGGTVNGGDDASPTQLFTISVTPVNDAPSFTLSGNETTLEDSGAQTSVGFISDITAGPLNESGQTVLFNITNNSNMALFAVQPGLDSSGTLSYTPAAGAVGMATITIEIMDDGGTANGGVDTSVTQMFDIIITEVNDEPVFTAGADQTILEDAGPQFLAGWATGISAGSANEPGQTLTFNITNNSNMALFTTGPAVAANGTLTYTPTTNANGSADISIELMDDGGTANGGDDTSPVQTFTINVTTVNDEPAFIVGADQTVAEGAGAQMVNGFISGISAGPADESGQTVSLNITGNTNPGLFSAGPSIDASGNLSYTPAVNASGSATITVAAMDDAGTANGGDDTSPGQMFDINVVDVNDAPSFIAGANPAATDEDAGPQSLAWASALSAGPASESGQILSFNLTQNSIDTTLSFTSGPTVNNITGNVEYTAAADAHGSASYSVVLMDDGGTANGGVDTSSPAVVLTLTINPVNDPPTVNGTPMAQAALGNVSISIAQAQGLLSTVIINDVDGAGALPFSISGAATPGITSFMSANGGDVSINATTGSFSYNPPAGFTGADTFDYFVCDSGAPGVACSTAVTATVTITGLIWFVDNTAAAGGDGRLSAPFNDFGGGGSSFNANAADSPNEVIFISSQGAYAGGVTLLAGQQLVGSGATTDILTVTGLSLPPNSATLPAFTGIRPVVSGNASNGITLGSGNTVRGLDFGNSNTMILGSNFATLTLSEVLLNGTGRGLSLDTGMATATFDSISSSNSASEGILLNNLSGSFTVSGLTTVTNPASVAVNILNTPATYTFADVTINNRSNVGVSISGLSGGQQTGQFGAVTINNQNTSNATAFSITNVVTAASTIIVSSVMIDNNGSNSPTISLSNNDGATINIQGGSVQNSAGTTVSISSSSGSATYAGSISNTAGRSVQVLNNTGGISTFSGNITDSGSGIFVNNNTGASINFSGILDLDTTTNTAFNVTAGGTISASNINSTINTSTGIGVNIDATSIGGLGVAFRSVSVNGSNVGINLNSAAGSGAFTVTGTGTTNGSGGTIQNTAQNGILIANTNNINLNNMNLINATTADTGGANSNAAIELNSVTNANLINLNLSGHLEHGILGTSVINLDISNTTINGTGADTETNEHGIFITNLLGSGASSSVFNNLNINDSQDTAIRIVNNTSTALVTIQDSSIVNAGDSGINFITSNVAANLTANVTGSVITNTIDGVAYESQAGTLTGAVGGAGVLSNTISPGALGDMVNAIRFFASGTSGVATLDGSALNNLITLDAVKIMGVAPVSGLNGVGIATGGMGTIRAIVNDNTIESSFSGILTQTVHGVLVNNEGVGSTSQNVVEVNGNTITLTPAVGTNTAETVGIGVDGGLNGGGITVRLVNNIIRAEGDDSNGASVGAQILPTEVGDPVNTNNRVCIDFTGNDISTPNNPFAGAFSTVELDVIAAPVVIGSFLDVENSPLGVRTPAQLVTDLDALNTAETGDTTGLISGVITGVIACPN